MTLLMMLLTASTAWAQFSGGDGSENNPYEIASYDDLLTLRNNVNNGERYGNCYFRQTADITWPDGTTWDRGIGYSNTGSHYFRGRYDGNGKKITGFRLATSEQNAGLFGYVLGDYRGTDATNNVIAEVKNVVLVDPVITAQATSGEQYVGTLVGYVSRCVKIDDNTVIGGSVTITGVSNNDNSVYAGGLVGYYYNGDWPSLKRNIVSGTTVSGAGVSGGLVGRLYFSYCVDQNFVDATVSSVQHTGDAGTFYRQGAVVGECYRISNNSNDFTWGYYHNTAGLTFFAKDANGNTKNDQLKTSRIYAVGIAPSDITVSGDGHHSFCGKHYCHGGASITLSGGTNPGYLVSGYTSTDVTITNGAFTMPAKDVTVSATFTPNPAHIEQTTTDEYTIHSAEGWGVFCDMLQDNATYNRFIGKTVKLDKDITVTRMAGSDNHDICGTFDGCGHTITLDGNTKTNGCYALFRNAVGATIQNLHVDGTISTAGAYAAGLISGMWGTVKIKNCRVSVNILSSQSGECSHGGLVAKNNSGTLEITGCVFDGKLLTTNGSTRCGGFVGWNGGTLTISNSLYAPAELKDGETWVGNDYSSPFAYNGATISNCYYTRDFNDGTHYTAQGKAPRTVEAGDYVTVEAVSPVGSPVEDGTYNVSGITAYAKGITRGDAFYYGNGDEVSLTLSHAEPPAGYTFTGYTASAGTLDGTTLTMPDDGDVTINANYESIKFTQGALSYECTNGTEVKMTACDKSATSVTIPTTVTYDEVTYRVTAIGNAAFADCTSLTTVFMQPTTPPTLGDNAFANCDELANIYVPAGTVETYKTTGNWATYKDIIQIDDACGDDVYWSYDSDSHKLTIYGTGAMADYNDSYRPWVTYCDDITTVDIRDGVTTIGNAAFADCTSLTTVFMQPTTPPTLGNDAFEDCTALYTIVVPTEVVLAYKAAWTDYADKILSIDGTCGDNVYWSYNSDSYKLTIFGTGAMADYDSCFSPWKVYCEDITTANISNGVTSIGKDAFYGCTAMTSVTIPNSVTTIDNGAFSYCGRLASIDIPDGVTSIGDGAFSYCDGLTNTTIPASVTSIGAEAFFECTNLTELIVQRSDSPITQLGDIVFYHCSDELTIYVPIAAVDDYKAADNWSSYADKIKGFGSCGDNVYWSYDSYNETLTIFGTGAMENYDSNNRPWESYCDDITTIDIRAGVTTIGDYAFTGCYALSSIDIPASVTTIGEQAFAFCICLTSITIPASVTTIGNSAFESCTGLKEITIPNGVTTIGNSAFQDCRGLTSIEIPASVTTIGEQAFAYCGCLASITILNGVTSIGNHAFTECTSLTSIDIPASVTTIGEEAFAFCSGLTSINIPASVTSISDAAFRDCTGLTNIEIPASVTSIGDYAFADCTSLTSIDIPASVTSIGEDAFLGCTGLSAFMVDNGNTAYAAEDGVLFNKDKTTLILYPLGNNRTSYTIPNSVTTIGDGAFACCTGLTSIDIPASVTSIGKSAFGACTSLTSITIPACVTSIGEDAFADCTGLTTVFMESTTPPSLGDYAFCECDALDAIYVPTGTSGAYKTADNWSNYEGIIKETSEITEIALADNASNSGLIAAVNGQTHHVTLQGRTLTKNGEWNTLCLPFSMTAEQIAASPLAGATIKTLDNTVNGTSLSDAGVLTLKFTDATAITAGVPYIIKWTETGDNITNPKFTGVTISSTEPTPVTSTDGKVTFVGQYSPFEIVESGATGDNQGNKNEIIMLSSGNKLGYSKNPRTLHTFRCHFYIPTNDSQQQARSFVLDFGDGETTAITTTDFMDFTDKAGAWYTIDGRKLDKQPAKKGLYIMNGKKVKR